MQPKSLPSQLEPEAADTVVPACEEFSAVLPPEIPADQVPPASGTHVASVEEKSGFRLHRVGECSFRQGIHYGLFEVLGDSMPPATAFNPRCKWCFFQNAASHAEAKQTATSSWSSSGQSPIE